jgi:hypothetical protein
MDIPDHPHVCQALEKDEKDLSHLLWSVMCSDSLENSVLELRGNEADAFMNLIWEVCSSCIMAIQLPDHFIYQIMHKQSFGDDETYYQKAHRLLLKLSQACDKIPSKLFITGVKLVVKDVASGGFANIHRGSYRGVDVALKSVRVFLNNHDHQPQKIQWVQRLCQYYLVDVDLTLVPTGSVS